MPSGVGPARPTWDVEELLRRAASLGASTLYLASNTRPSVRVDGVVQALEGTRVLGSSEIETMQVVLLLAHHGGRRRVGIEEWSFDVAEVGHIRCTPFQDRRGPGMLFRILPAHGAAAEPVELDIEIQMLAVERDGLVVVAGPRASGKQAVIGALVDLVGRTRRGYVITVQREVSGAVEAEGSFISQREARGGLEDMLSLARAALRENPDVLVLQEVRSAALMDLAFDAAASGQLVIAGLTAPSTRAIERIVDLYPPEQARHVSLSLAQHLRGIVGQVLVPKIGGGRAAARELLLNTPAVSSVLASGAGAYLAAAIDAAREQGAVPLNDSLADLVRRGVVTPADAYRHAADPVGFIDELKRLGFEPSIVHPA